MTLYKKTNGDEGLYSITQADNFLKITDKSLYVCVRIDNHDDEQAIVVTNDYVKENFEKVDVSLETHEIPFTCDSYTYYEITKHNDISLDYIIGNEPSLKNKILVPLADDRIIPFSVQHIDYNAGKTYFVADVSVGESTMNDMNTFLDKFEKLMPKSLLDECVNIEHITPKHTTSRKIVLLSSANIGEDNANICTGADDIKFDGLLTEAERCLNDTNGETCWWWLDTEYVNSDNVCSATNFAYVFGYGAAAASSASYAFGVRPAFCLT